jgi:hypothetical protein
MMKITISGSGSGKDSTTKVFPWNNDDMMKQFDEKSITTKPSASHKDIDVILDHFTTFLKGSAAVNEKTPGKMNEWHILFNMGTVVRDDETTKEFIGFDTSASKYDYPEHRIIGDDTTSIKTSLAKTMLENNLRWKHTQKSALNDAQKKLISRSYTQLIGNGYPYPGTPDADRMAIPGSNPYKDDNGNLNERMCWFIYRPNCSEKVFTIVDTAVIPDIKKLTHVAADYGMDMFRYDYMMPTVYALISPDLTVYKIQDPIQNQVKDQIKNKVAPE